jgi:hypothetical protein
LYESGKYGIDPETWRLAVNSRLAQLTIARDKCDRIDARTKAMVDAACGKPHETLLKAIFWFAVVGVTILLSRCESVNPAYQYVMNYNYETGMSYDVPRVHEILPEAVVAYPSVDRYKLIGQDVYRDGEIDCKDMAILFKLLVPESRIIYGRLNDNSMAHVWIRYKGVDIEPFAPLTWRSPLEYRSFIDIVDVTDRMMNAYQSGTKIDWRW